MGNKSKKSKDVDPLVALALAKRAEVAAAPSPELPTMPLYEANPAAMALASKSFTGGGGSSIGKVVKGVTTFKRIYPADFVCRCRVTGETAKWKWLSSKQCQRWVQGGDMTVSACERVASDNKLADLPGEERLEAVRNLLDAAGVDAPVASSPARAGKELIK